MRFVLSQYCSCQVAIPMVNKIKKGKTMTVVAYIIASLVKAYRLKKEAKRMENIVRAAGFAY